MNKIKMYLEHGIDLNQVKIPGDTLHGWPRKGGEVSAKEYLTMWKLEIEARLQSVEKIISRIEQSNKDPKSYASALSAEKEYKKVIPEIEDALALINKYARD